MPRHRRFTTHLGRPPEQLEETAQLPSRLRIGGVSKESGDLFGLPLAFGLAAGAGNRFKPSPPRKNRHWEWLAALLVHAAIIALALISFPPPMSLSPPSQSNVSIVFDNTGSQQTAAPPAQLQGPPTVAEVPPAPAPPPSAPQPLQPEMNLDIPQDLFSQLPLATPVPQPPPPQPQQAQNTRPAHNSRPTHHQYQVMNNMSFGNGSSGAPAPPMPNAQHGLNLQLSQSDLNAMNTPEFTVQGEIGSDWMSGFNKWVNDHIYYPQAAIEQHQEGTSVIQFTVHRDGRITGLHLLSSAGSNFLDLAWLGIFAQNNVPPFPPGTKSDTIKITASLQYELVQ